MFCMLGSVYTWRIPTLQASLGHFPSFIRAVQILSGDALAIGNGRSIVSAGFNDDRTMNDVAQVFGKPSFEIVHEQLFGSKVFRRVDTQM